MAESDPLRIRLADPRADVLHQLAALDGVDAGLLRLAADAGAALAALDAAAAATVAPEPGARCIVSDDGREIMVTVYSSDRRCAAAVLSPVAAIRLAGQLISCAVRHL